MDHLTTEIAFQSGGQFKGLIKRAYLEITMASPLYTFNLRI